MYEILPGIANKVSDLASALPDMTTNILPTAEEPGFKLTINLGQVIQLLGILIVSVKFYTAIVTRHNNQANSILVLKTDVDTLKEDIREIKSDLKQLPTVVQAVHRQEKRSETLIGKVDEIPTRADGGMSNDEFIDEIAKRMAKLIGKGD